MDNFLLEAVRPYINILRIFGIFIEERKDFLWIKVLIIHIYFTLVIQILFIFPKEISTYFLNYDILSEFCGISAEWHILGESLRYSFTILMCYSLISYCLCNRKSAFIRKIIKLATENVKQKEKMFSKLLAFQDMLIGMYSFNGFYFSFGFLTFYIFYISNDYKQSHSLFQNYFCTFHLFSYISFEINMSFYSTGFLALLIYLTMNLIADFITHVKENLEKGIRLNSRTILYELSLVMHFVKSIDKLFQNLNVPIMIIIGPVLSINFIYILFSKSFSLEMFIILIMHFFIGITLIIYSLYLARIPSKMQRFTSSVMDIYFQNEENPINCQILLYLTANHVGLKNKNFFYFSKHTILKYVSSYMNQVISILLLRELN